MSANELRPVSVEVPAVSPVQLPVLTSGGATITNTDTTNAELSSTQAFSTGTTQVLSPGTSAYFAVGPVWARVPSGSSADQVTLFIAPGPAGGNAAPTALAITNATIPIAGSVDANITNASLPVSGSVSVSSGSVSISGTPTVNISAGQVVEVQNASGGSLTVAGTVDAAVTGNVTIDAGTVDIQPVQSALLYRTSTGGSGSTTVTPAATALALHIIADDSAIVTVQGSTTLAYYQVPSPAAPYGGTSVFVCTIDTAADASYNIAVELPPNDFSDWYIAAVYSGATAVVNPVVDGGPNSQIQIQSTTASSDFTVNVNTSCTALRINASTGADNPPTVGTFSASGTIAPYYPVRLLSLNTDGSTWWECLITPNLANATPTTLQVTFPSAVASTYIYSVSRVSGWPTYKGTYIATLTNPAAATDVSYTLPFDARIRRFMGEFQANSGLNGQSAYLAISGQDLSYGGYIPLTGKVAYTYNHINAWIGGPTGIIAPESGALNVIEAPLPDMVLSAGTQIATVTFSMGATDQWNHVQIVLEAA